MERHLGEIVPKRLLREMVGSLSLEILKNRIDLQLYTCCWILERFSICRLLPGLRAGDEQTHYVFKPSFCRKESFLTHRGLNNNNHISDLFPGSLNLNNLK